MKRSLSLTLALSLFLLQPASAQLMQLEKEELPDPSKVKTQATVTPFISWIDSTVPVKGYLLCVHGLGLHKGTYRAFGERMAKMGWGVYAVDVRGFGSFQQMPGQAPRTVDFEGCLQDVKAALEFMHKEHPGAPIFIAGESMGGGIALQAASRFPELVDGLISCVPGAKRKGGGGDAVKVGLRLITGPKREMDVSKIVVDRSTKDEELKNEWLNDHMARFKLSPLELMHFQSFMNNNAGAARKITKTPVLMMSGTEDDLVKASNQEYLIKEIPCADKHQVFIVGAEHLILEEGQFDDSVITMVTDWLTDHSARSVDMQASGKVIK